MGSKLAGAKFRKANLTAVDFSRADLWKSDLRDAEVKDATFQGAFMRIAKLPDGMGALNMCQAILPSGEISGQGCS